MKGFLFVDATTGADKGALAKWVKLSLAHLLDLTPKEKSAKARTIRRS